MGLPDYLSALERDASLNTILAALPENVSLYRDGQGVWQVKPNTTGITRYCKGSGGTPEEALQQALTNFCPYFSPESAANFDSLES